MDNAIEACEKLGGREGHQAETDTGAAAGVVYPESGFRGGADPG